MMRTLLGFFLMLCLVNCHVAAQIIEKGNASYYSSKLRGRKTASGEPYNADSMMCAHKKLPFGTRIRVYNPANGKEVVVRVTDRGPFRKNFIVDLSYAAAKEIGILRSGYMPVEVTVLKDNIVPFKAEPRELPELDMCVTTDSVFGKPEWQQNDSVPALKPKTDSKTGTQHQTKQPQKQEQHQAGSQQQQKR